jgi:hypothetical protein
MCVCVYVFVRVCVCLCVCVYVSVCLCENMYHDYGPLWIILMSTKIQIERHRVCVYMIIKIQRTTGHS